MELGLVRETGETWRVPGYDKSTKVRCIRRELGCRNRDLTFSPDGKWLACAGLVIELWDTIGGTMHKRLNETANSVAFSTDSEYIAAGCCSGKVILWETATGTQLWTSDLYGSPIYCTAASSETTKEIHRLAFSPNGQVLAAAATDGTIAIRDVADGKAWATCPALPECSVEIEALAYSPDGELLASAQGKDVLVWKPDKQMAPIYRFHHEDYVHAVAFLPHSRLLASASYDMKIRLWDPATEKVHRTFQCHRQKVVSHDISPSDYGRSFPSEGPSPIVMAFSPGGKRLASATHSTFILWDVATGEVLREICAENSKSGLGIRKLMFSSNGWCVLTNRGRVRASSRPPIPSWESDIPVHDCHAVCRDGSVAVIKELDWLMICKFGR